MQNTGLAEAAHKRRVQTAALALSALCVSIMLSNAHGAECINAVSLPCSFGDCEFSKDASGVLDRTGSCPTQGGTLYLFNKDIKGLREGVFRNMGACEYLYLDNNQLTALPATVFNGLTNLKRLHLNRNQLTALPATVFNGLTKLEELGLYSNQLTALPATVFNGLTNLPVLVLYNNQLTALPATVFNGNSLEEVLPLGAPPSPPRTTQR